MKQKKNWDLFLNMIISETEPVDIVKRAIDSIKDYVDGMYIAVTYKGDKPGKESAAITKLLKSYNANVFSLKWEYDFGKARQFVTDKTPKGKDKYFVWIDADDVFKNPEKMALVIEDMIKFNQAAVFFQYYYTVELDEQQNIKEVIIKHKRERIIKNDDSFKWVGALHETLIEQQTENVVKIFRDECSVVHLSDTAHHKLNLTRNIEILENQVKKTQRKEPRYLVYLAKAYYDRGQSQKDSVAKKIDFDMATVLFKDYLEGIGKPGSVDYIAPSGWREERATAWANLGEMSILMKNIDQAILYYKQAIDEAWDFPGYYIDLALAYSIKKDLQKAKHFLKIGSSISEPNTTIITFPKQIKTRALHVAIEVAMHESRLEDALKLSESLKEIDPKDQGVQNNINVIKNLITFNKACQSFVYLGKYLEAIKDSKALVNLVNSIPPVMQGEKFATEMKKLFLPPRVWGEDEIALVCGPGFEKWSPKNVEDGIGGSEEAVINLAKELAKKGWKITVYGDPQEDAGDYEGVAYKPWHSLNQSDVFNIIVLWRSIGFVDINPKSRFTMLWCHDVPNNPDYTENRLSKIDKIAVLSEYHKSLFRMNKGGTFEKIPDEKFFLTSNGIPDLNLSKDFDIYKGSSKRIIYMSSLDRGVVYLLKDWSKIKKEVPDAELHVFYGWNIFDSFHKNNPAMMKWKQDVEAMLRQPGIFYHGRVGHDRLHREIAKSGIWAYPTHFQEISCISAMKAQALGAVPVVTNYAALEETVKNGLRVDVDIKEQSGQDEYTKNLIDLLKDKKKQDEIRKTMISFAKKYFLWSTVADSWDKILKEHSTKEVRLQVKDIKEVK